ADLNDKPGDKPRSRLQFAAQEKGQASEANALEPVDPEFLLEDPPSLPVTFETVSSGLTDADLHETLGGELKGELIIRPEKYWLGSFVDVHRGTWVQINGEKSEVIVKVLQATGLTTSGDQWSKMSGYSSPELLTSDSTIVAPLPADIYAFGGVILAVLSGLSPHYNIMTRGRLFVAVIGGAVPVPADHPGLLHTDPLWEFMNICWAFEPNDRPTVQQVANTLGRQRKENAPSTVSSKSIRSREVLEPVDEGPDVELPDSKLDLLAELPGELNHETDPLFENTLRGGFSDVVKGRWTRPDGETVTVAIKYLRTVAMQTSPTTQDKVARMNKRMDREVLVWRGLNSRYILELYGFRSGEQPCLVSPWCKNGTLHDYLTAHPTLVVLDKLELLVRTGKGLQYLHEHSPPISHGDIKPSNILIDDNNRPRLCDFGLSQFLEQANPELQTSFVGQGSKGYQAPEVVRDGLQDLPSDVYAFGCLVLEVMSGNPPFYKLKAPKAFLAISAGSIPEPSAHPKLPPSDPIWDILRKCWAAPSARPAAKAVVQM
ncbi:hypothetical protein FS837_004251, partial [Tulasnella sp. UAMH 9824]